MQNVSSGALRVKSHWDSFRGNFKKYTDIFDREFFFSSYDEPCHEKTFKQSL